jgi:RimJ/RimL family protein N-acetyltransferase
VKDVATQHRAPELRDGRLLLRALHAADKAAVVASCNDPATVRYLDLIPYPYHDADFDAWLKETRRQWRTRSQIVWAIADVTSGDWLGSIALTFAAQRQAAEIGYHVAPWARRRGVAAAAARLVRDWAFDELRVERLELITEVENAASRRAAEAVGFRREGTMRAWTRGRDGRRHDHLVYALLPGDRRR